MTDAPTVQFRSATDRFVLESDQLITAAAGSVIHTPLRDVVEIRLTCSLGEGRCLVFTRALGARPEAEIVVKPGADQPGADVRSYLRLVRTLHDRVPDEVALRSGAAWQVAMGALIVVVGALVAALPFVAGFRLRCVPYGIAAMIGGAFFIHRGRPRRYRRDAIPAAVLPRPPRVRQD